MSRKNIDADLNNINQEVSTFDFGYPQIFTKDRIMLMTKVNEIFTRRLETLLFFYTRTIPDVKVESVSQINYEGFMKPIYTPSTISIIDIPSLNGKGVIEITPSLIFAIIEKICGGNISSRRNINREPTEIESVIMEEVIKDIIKDLGYAWSNNLNSNFGHKRIDEDSKYTDIADPKDETIVITFKIKFEANEGYLKICFPYKTIKPLIRQFGLLYKGNKTSTSFIENLKLRSFNTHLSVKTKDEFRSDLQVKPFDSIRRYEPTYLLKFLQEEHPQIIAMVLAYLEPDQSRIILGCLPDETQSDIAKRIAIMDRINPSVLKKVEQVLEKRLSILASEERRSAGGIDTIVEILNMADRRMVKTILKTIREEYPELTENIRNKMFLFEDVVILCDRDIQKIFKELDTTDLAIALKGAKSKIRNKFFKNMSKRVAAVLKEDMVFMGPVKLKKVEECQKNIVAIIRRLEKSGYITIERDSEDDKFIV